MPCSKKFLVNLSGLQTPSGLSGFEKVLDVRGNEVASLSIYRVHRGKTFLLPVHPAFICTEMENKLYYYL